MINLGQSVTLTPQITGQGVCDASNPSANTIQYLWNTGQTTSSIVVTPFESTFYRVTVTDCFECTDTESVTIHINMNTPMVMFPNPSNGTINIVSDSDLESNTSIRLYAVNGTIVIDNNVEITKHSQRKISANLSSNLPNGVYILEFKNGDQVFREKLIIHNK